MEWVKISIYFRLKMCLKVVAKLQQQQKVKTSNILLSKDISVCQTCMVCASDVYFYLPISQTLDKLLLSNFVKFRAAWLCS